MDTIFVVDDNSANLLLAENVLSEHYEVITMVSAKIMFELIENIKPDLILLDIMMPDISGFDALKQLKSGMLYADIPVIFLTSKNDAATEAAGFEMGVVDFITKPFSGPVLLHRIKSILHMESIIRERTEMLQQQAEVLQRQTETLKQRTDKLLRLQNSMTSVLAHLVENRDKLTGEHIERTSEYIKLLLGAMIERKIYLDQIADWDMDVIISAARLHDLGKIVVSDLILNKPDKLMPSEFEMIKTHAIEGEKIITDIIIKSGDDVFLHHARELAGSHHERWDGTGYPRGLKGEDIPLLGRIMSIADVYDALVSDRPYKKAFPHETAVAIILDSRGTQFDPVLADLFYEINESFAKVHNSDNY
ncbi:MAG: response regulator [Oscillospiraceae bacterium]|nr:response regulator [Oscillospiraceae bacterium]